MRGAAIGQMVRRRMKDAAARSFQILTNLPPAFPLTKHVLNDLRILRILVSRSLIFDLKRVPLLEQYSGDPLLHRNLEIP